MLRGVWVSMLSTRKVISGVMSEKAEDLVLFKELIEAIYWSRSLRHFVMSRKGIKKAMWWLPLPNAADVFRDIVLRHGPSLISG